MGIAGVPGDGAAPAKHFRLDPAVAIEGAPLAILCVTTSHAKRWGVTA